MNDNEYMLTTVDNPWNPFTDPDKWLQYDISHGYNTCNYLAKVVRVAEDWPEELVESEYNKGLRTILAEDPSHMYARIKSTDKTPLQGNAKDSQNSEIS